MAQSHRTCTRRKRKNKYAKLPPQVDEVLRLPPESDDGNVEYKSQLIQPTITRLQHLITQMKWRLQEGNGECYYCVGVLDDGTCQGLTCEEMAESMRTLCQMATSVGATLFILRDHCVSGTSGEADRRNVVEVLVRALPSDQHFVDMRVAVLGSASTGKSTLCGVLTSGILDNGNGKCRLNLNRYLHEIRSGKTSSVTLDIVGLSSTGEVITTKERDLKEVLEHSSKLITLIDLAGDKKYLKTTIFGISALSPHVCTLLVNARLGWTAMSEEHWEIAHAFKIPTVIVITKADLVNEARVERIVQQITSMFAQKSKYREVMQIKSQDDAARCANRMLTSTIVPVLAVSSVTGQNLNLLTSFLHAMPARSITTHTLERDARPLMYIEEVFKLAERGTVVCGLVAGGSFHEREHVQIGPDSAGNYQQATVVSLQRNKQAVYKSDAGETASLAVEFAAAKGANADHIKLRKGMVVLRADDEAISCRRFVARFSLIAHPVEAICVGFQGTVYLGSLRRTVTIVDFDARTLRLNDCLDVTFEFYSGAEYVRPNTALFFRERNTKGVGKVVQVLD